GRVLSRVGVADPKDAVGALDRLGRRGQWRTGSKPARTCETPGHSRRPGVLLFAPADRHRAGRSGSGSGSAGLAAVSAARAAPWGRLEPVQEVLTSYGRQRSAAVVPRRVMRDSRPPADRDIRARIAAGEDALLGGPHALP